MCMKPLVVKDALSKLCWNVLNTTAKVTKDGEEMLGNTKGRSSVIS